MSNQKIYEVEKILERRVNGSEAEYKIKWKGFKMGESTWEPAKNLVACKELLREFNQIAGIDSPVYQSYNFFNSTGIKDTAKIYDQKHRRAAENQKRMKKKSKSLNKLKIAIQIDDDEPISPPEVVQRPSTKELNQIDKQKQKRFYDPIQQIESLQCQQIVEMAEQKCEISSKKQEGTEGKIVEMLVNQKGQLFFRVCRGLNSEIYSRQSLLENDVFLVIDYYEKYINLID